MKTTLILAICGVNLLALNIPGTYSGPYEVRINFDREPKFGQESMNASCGADFVFDLSSQDDLAFTFSTNGKSDEDEAVVIEIIRASEYGCGYTSSFCLPLEVAFLLQPPLWYAV